MTHPTWCDRRHGDVPVHGGQVGGDLELTGELSYGVFLDQLDGEPAAVLLMRHTPDETSFTRLSILEASILRDLFGEGLGLLAREAGL